jgi:DNA replication initiation complex subunit (GINS family)
MLTFQELINIRAQEKLNNEIQPLPQDFSTQLKNLIQSSTGKELENIKKVAKEIMELRKSKILIYLSLNKIPENLIENEKELFQEINKILENYATKVDSLFSESKKNFKKVEILKELPKILIGEKEIGPYKKGEIVEIDEEIAQLLTKKGLCNLIEENTKQ